MEKIRISKDEYIEKELLKIDPEHKEEFEDILNSVDVLLEKT